MIICALTKESLVRSAVEQTCHGKSFQAVISSLVILVLGLTVYSNYQHLTGLHFDMPVLQEFIRHNYPHGFHYFSRNIVTKIKRMAATKRVHCTLCATSTCVLACVNRLNFGCWLVRFYRCHVTLHLSECPEKAMQCQVTGCKTIKKRKNYEEHVRTAAMTHAVLQGAEEQKLRGLMYFKVRYKSNFY